MTTLLPLSDYQITPDRGFLCTYDAAQVKLPDAFAAIEQTALALPRTIVSGNVRKHLEALPAFDLSELCVTADESVLRKAMVHYSFMVQSYVWGEPDAPSNLPETLAKPIWQLAERLGQKPLLLYTGYVLDNWAMFDPNGAIDLDNVYMIQPFLSGEDEAWFVLIHVAIEARAGEMLAEAPLLIDAVNRNDGEQITNSLRRISSVWDAVNAIFDRMPDRCDPYIYYNRVRPYIHGWKDNPALGDGLIYDGVAEANGKPQAFRGQTGSQSSIVPSMDALYGVEHSGDALRKFLDELHAYRPPAHRRFIDDIRAASTLRDWMEQNGSTAQRELYNENILKLARFRTRHLEYAASYINKQAKSADGNDTDVGTGGTPFMKYLKKHRDEARSHVIAV